MLISSLLLKTNFLCDTIRRQTTLKFQTKNA